FPLRADCAVTIASGEAGSTSNWPYQARPGQARPNPASARLDLVEGVDPVEHAPVAGEQAAAVLHAHVPLQQRLEQVAQRSRGGERRAEQEHLADREKLVAILVEGDERDEDRRHHAADEPLPGLAG